MQPNNQAEKACKMCEKNHEPGAGKQCYCSCHKESPKGMNQGKDWQNQKGTDRSQGSNPSKGMDQTHGGYPSKEKKEPNTKQ